MNVTHLTIEEVRCFAEPQQLDLRPLTFVVGENSTGKTTALACIQVLADFLSGEGLNFNSDPYFMGIFRDIVRRSMKREKSFGIGIGIQTKDGDVEFNVKFTEKEDGVEPVVQSLSIRFSDGEIILKSSEGIGRRFDPRILDREQNRHVLEVDSLRLNSKDPFFPLVYFLNKRLDSKSEHQRVFSKFLSDKTDSIGSFLRPGNEPNIRVFSTSPFRSPPERTYNPTRITADTRGSDVPMRMMLMKSSSPERWSKLRHALARFGENSGLFQSIDVKKLGPSAGAPFQVTVKVRGPTVNIVDVGYGIGQILPILVNVLDYEDPQDQTKVEETPKSFLLQQPEVHLHPRAQAELTSLLAHLASLGNRSFIIETNSDYMVDRARIEIMRGNIDKDDVSLIYLEHKKNVVKVHNISFDEMGNLIGVPPHFRDFFLQESGRLMGFLDS